MAPSESEDDLFDDVEDEEEEPEREIEEELPIDVAVDDATEGDDEDLSEDSEDESNDDDDDEDAGNEISNEQLVAELQVEMAKQISRASSSESQSQQSKESKAPSPAPLRRRRSPSPASVRRKNLRLKAVPRTFIVEAICALPHPVPTHSLAASQCMTHLLTGSDDGYIRDYDIFTALNSKNFLSAPQRHHSGVVEGIMKAGQIRFWWENPALPPVGMEAERSLAPVYSLAVHSDALWALAGTDTGPINLFTVRHEPGRLCHTFTGHRGPVSAMSMDHDEQGFFSAGWDGDAILWDLNTGQVVRNFTAHGSQLTAVAVRPTDAVYTETGSPVETHAELNETTEDRTAPNQAQSSNPQADIDAKSDASHDSLFDDDDGDGNAPTNASKNGSASKHQSTSQRNTVPVPKGAPPLLDSERYKTFSPDILMTAAIDGQVMLWDKRVNSTGTGVGRLWISDKTPPWCLSACWSADGNQIYAGRRNGAVEVYDMRQLGRSGPTSTPRLLKTLRNPQSSGVVSCVVAFPDNRHIACASIDNIRLWNVADAVEADASGRTKSTQFKIIPGHHGGYISQMLVDPGARFLISASSNRGWHGDSTKTVFIHDIKHIR
ncbi:transcription factor [Moniliophthora roreri MCA 2997]|uniref:Transcription factor n=2 Tax=Moniliophthora roreri TaxID=221103 RepID=V2YS82_MONRO|nr:transcription factor [Moniliophthora roreri MCA 2997]KAI3610790.1 transcription factor [Moniliophthora roreri]